MYNPHQAIRYCEMLSQDSLDPSTKVGAIIINKGMIVGQGFNKFPKGIQVTEERLNNRELKYPRTIHAEMVALVQAGQEAKGGILYSTHPPCDCCSVVIIEAEISRIYYPEYNHGHRVGTGMMNITEAGIPCVAVLVN